MWALLYGFVSVAGRLRPGADRPLSAHCLPTAARCSLFHAQTPGPDETGFRIDTDLVNLNVSVFNRNSSKTVAPLEQNRDFAVVESGEPQEILFFASGETPFDLVLLLDLSGSTVDKIDLIRKSSKRFVDAARPSDRIAILAFAADIQVVSKLSSDHYGA